MRHGSMLVALPLIFAATSPAMSAEIASGSCPITFPQGGIQGNEALTAVLPRGGKFVFAPGGAGFVDRDGALGIKFAFDRLIAGQLSVGGRRLDGDAGRARAHMSNGYGDIGFQPVYLVFPTPGCWEITGRVGEAKLTFVLLVEKVGDGPAWKFEGLDRGWRQTTG
jgi:hypothetical protein